MKFEDRSELNELMKKDISALVDSWFEDIMYISSQESSQDIEDPYTYWINVYISAAATIIKRIEKVCEKMGGQVSYLNKGSKD